MMYINTCSLTNTVNRIDAMKLFINLWYRKERITWVYRSIPKFNNPETSLYDNVRKWDLRPLPIVLEEKRRMIIYFNKITS